MATASCVLEAPCGQGIAQGWYHIQPQSASDELGMDASVEPEVLLHSATFDAVFLLHSIETRQRHVVVHENSPLFLETAFSSLTSACAINSVLLKWVTLPKVNG
eukprot:5596031-Amphidinium_carterae.1